MKRKIITLAILFLFVLLNYVNAKEILESVYYIYLIIYRNDTVTLTNFEVIDGIPTDFPTIPLELNYSILILSIKNEILFKAQLPVSFTAYPMPPEGEPHVEVELNESIHYLRLPYFENANKIEIYHEDKLIFSYEICKVNEVCEEKKGETNFNCPEDCKPKSVCGNRVCETGEDSENCPEDCPTPGKPTRPMWVYLIIGVVIALVIVALSRIKVVRG